MNTKAHHFIGELNNQFGKNTNQLGLLQEIGKIHTLFYILENQKYQIKMNLTREVIKHNPVDIKEIIKKMYSQIEGIEPSLSGVFLDESFLEIDENTLYKLIVLFERYGLTTKEYQSHDLVIHFFDTVIEELLGNIKGLLSTPKGLTELMIHSIKPVGGSVYDATAGIANLPIAAFEYAKNNGNGHILYVYGQEIDCRLYTLGKLNLFIHGILPEYGDLQLGDTIRNPKWIENNRLKQFDSVIMNYPFGMNNWGHEFAVNDPFGRFELYGVPSRVNGDYAFILHALASLKNNGRAAIVVPFGTLVRGAAERKIRSILLKDDVIESIVALPSNLFSGTGIQVALLILNKNKPEHKKGKVQFINAEGDYERTRTQKFLNAEHVEKITDSLDSYENQERYSRIVSINEIEENNYDLNPTLYFVNVELNTEFGSVLFNKKKYEESVVQLVSVNKIAEVIRGVNLPGRRQQEQTNAEKYKVIQIRDVEDGKILFDKMDEFPIQARDIERVTAQQGDILVSSRGTQQKIAVVPEHEGTILVSNMFVIIRLHDMTAVNPNYIKRILESPVGAYYFEVNQRGMMATVLTPNDISTIEIPLVSIKQQNELIDQLEMADDLIRKAQQERQKQYFGVYENLGIKATLSK